MCGAVQFERTLSIAHGLFPDSRSSKAPGGNRGLAAQGLSLQAEAQQLRAFLEEERTAVLEFLYSAVEDVSAPLHASSCELFLICSCVLRSGVPAQAGCLGTPRQASMCRH